ncbi:MAG: hypothetical protein WA217_04320, partial [Candidatus Binatus sp.]
MAIFGPTNFRPKAAFAGVATENLDPRVDRSVYVGRRWRACLLASCLGKVIAVVRPAGMNLNTFSLLFKENSLLI